MKIGRAAFGSALWFALAPGVVAGVIPWWITRWQPNAAPAWALPLRVAGTAAIVWGVIVLLGAFRRFVVEGLGTPAPVAPTEHLVVGGWYRYVRNPMYVAVLAVIVGQAAVLWNPSLIWYGAIVAAAFVFFVKVYEEPTLARQFGAQYEAYRRAVPGWIPRLRPWVQEGTDRSE